MLTEYLLFCDFVIFWERNVQIQIFVILWFDAFAVEVCFVWFTNIVLVDMLCEVDIVCDVASSFLADDAFSFEQWFTYQFVHDREELRM